MTTKKPKDAFGLQSPVGPEPIARTKGANARSFEDIQHAIANRDVIDDDDDEPQPELEEEIEEEDEFEEEIDYAAADPSNLDADVVNHRHGYRGRGRHEVVIYEAGNLLLRDDSWPATPTANQSESGMYSADFSIDGDSAVVLVRLVNVLKEQLGVLQPFVNAGPDGTTIPERCLPHLLRFLIRAAGPYFADHLEDDLDDEERRKLLDLVAITRLGSSAVREARELERARDEKLRSEEAAKVKKEEALQKRAEAEVEAEEKAERAAKIEAKLAELGDGDSAVT
jgi:hypothetical protein